MYVQTIGPPTAKIFLVGEAPGEEENRTGKPFVPTAPAGRRLDYILQQAGLSRHECLIGNVAREQPPGNDMKFFYTDSKQLIRKPILSQWIQELKQEIIAYKPNIVIALGRHAHYALYGDPRLRSFRGYITESTLVPGQKLLSTWHPQATNYESKLLWQAVMDVRKAALNSETPGLLKDERELVSSPTKNEFIEYLKFLLYEHEEPVSVDIEVSLPGSHIDIIGLAHHSKFAMSFNFMAGPRARYLPKDEAEVWYWIARVLSERELIMHNGAYDYAVLWHHNHILASGFKYDTMVATHVVWPEIPRSLGFLSSVCLNVPPWKHTSASSPTLYNAADATNTYGIWLRLEKELTKMESWNTFNFEMSQIEPSVYMQLKGVPIDTDKQQVLLYGGGKEKKGIYAEAKALHSKVEKELGKTINLNSPQQLKEALYVDMKLPPQFKRRKKVTDTKQITTNAEALTKLSRMTGNPILEDILKYKKLTKLATFVNISTSPEKKVHTSYNVTGATMSRKAKGLVVDDEDTYKSFGRWSSSESIILPFGSGNLQQIPEKARKIYTAPPGMTIVKMDYVQAEAVVVAFVINDQPLKSLFRESFGLRREERQSRNLDVHKRTAANMFGIEIELITKPLRDIGKAIRHATNYSAGPAVLADKIGCSMTEAKKLLSMHHLTCPQLRIWHSRIQQTLTTTRVLENLLGRKHRFLERWGDELFRSAYSYIPQSTVGDLLNETLVKTYTTFGDSLDLFLQLHDALYVVVPENKIDLAISSMHKCAIRPLTFQQETFYIDVDFAIGKSWGTMEEVDWQDYVSQEEIDHALTLYS